MRAADVLKEAFLYGLLLAIGVAFSLPLLWMMVTSVKVDREFMDASRVFPEIPRPAEISPYLVAEADESLPPEALRRWETEFREVFGDRVPGAIATVVSGEAAALAGEALVTREQAEFLLDRAWNRNVREFLIRKPVLRSRDRRTFQYDSSEGWRPDNDRVEVGEPYRPDREETLMVAYSLTENGSGFRLAFLLEMDPWDAVEADEIVLPVHADDSWHRVYLAVETADGKWRSRAPFYLLLSSAGWTELSWRKPDFPGSRLAYEYFKRLRMTGGGNSDLRAGQVLLTLEVERSNLVQAIWGKVSRNYEMVFAAMPFARYLLNSVILVALSVVSAIFSCSLAGYAFARLRWRGRQVYFIIMLATMTIPPQVTMVPTFIIMRHLGFYNTYLPLVLPSMIAVPFFVFLLRQFLKNIPRDLEDAALIDGCSHLRIYWHIMLPLIKPTLVIVAILTFIATWNDFLGPLIYLSDQNLYPVSLGIFAFQSYAGGVGLGSPAVMMAASTLMVLPVIAVFFFAQRYFTQGIKMTGIK